MAALSREGTAGADPLEAGGVQAQISAENAGPNPKDEAVKNFATRVAPAVIGGMTPLGRVGGSLGGMYGEYRAQKNEGGNMRPGAIAAAGFANLIPGGSTVLKSARNFAGGNIAAKAIETGIDEQRAPTLSEAGVVGGLAAIAARFGQPSGKSLKQIQNAVRDQTVAEAQAAGYVIPPSKINPGPINNTLESLAGKAATAQEAAARNQEITNALARKSLGLPATAPLTETTLRQVRQAAAMPYEELSSIAQQAEKDLAALKKSRFTAADPHELAIQQADPATVREMSSLAIKTGADVNALKAARLRTQELYDAYKMSRGDPAVFEKAIASEKLAESLEQKIQSAANEMGRPELAQALMDSRVQIAKAHEIEKALNLADGNVSAPVLGRALDRGAPLTGDLKTAAKFQQAFPAFAREGASVPAAGVSKLKAFSSLGLGLGGYGTLGAPGAALAAAPFASDAARAAILSRPYQRFLNQPSYASPRPDLLAQFSRVAAQTAGR